MGQVQGRVKFDGQPIAQGHIYLFDDEKSTRPHHAPVTSGTFGLVAPVGTYRIEIFAQHDDQALAANPSLPMQYIPERYNGASTLTADVKPGVMNTVSFDLDK
jgi:hypothetical protein